MTRKTSADGRSTNTGGANAFWMEAALNKINESREPFDRSTLVILAKKIRDVRTLRNAVFAPELFGEPAWDLLLSLYIAEGDQYRLKVTSACNESNVPETTALRWLNSLNELGLIQYESNPTDARSRYVALSREGVASMDRLMIIASGQFPSRASTDVGGSVEKISHSR